MKALPYFLMAGNQRFFSFNLQDRGLTINKAYAMWSRKKSHVNFVAVIYTEGFKTFRPIPPPGPGSRKELK